MDGREGRRNTGRFTGRRVTMREAADELGLSVEAIRKRVQRGSMASDKGEDGRVYVYLDTARGASRPGSRTVEDAPAEAWELVEVLRAQVEDLRTDRDAWRDQARRSDYIAGAAMERTRELEGRLRELEPPEASPSERPGSSVGPEEGETSPTPGDTPAGPETSARGPERRPWWRRLIGG